MNDVIARVQRMAQEATKLSAQQKHERSETAQRNRDKYPDIADLMDRLHAGGFPRAKVMKLKGAPSDTSNHVRQQSQAASAINMGPRQGYPEATHGSR